MDDFNAILGRVPEAERARVQSWWNRQPDEASRRYALTELARKYPAPTTPQAPVPVAPSDVTATQTPVPAMPPRLEAFVRQAAPMSSADSAASAFLDRGAFLPERPNRLQAAGLGLRQGLTLGGSDELTGMFGGEADLQRLQNFRAQEDYPLTYAVPRAIGSAVGVLSGEALGARLLAAAGFPAAASVVAPTASRGLLSNMMRSGVEGVAVGATEGALSAPPGQRGQGAMMGGLAGGVAGPAMTGLMGGVSAAAGMVGGHPAFAGPQARVLSDLAQADNVGVDHVTRTLARNPNFRVVDALGPNARSAAEGLAQMAGPTREILEVLRTRGIERGRRIADWFEREIGSVGNPFKYAEDQRLALRERAKPLYDAALFTPDGKVRRIQAAEIGRLARGSRTMQQAWARALRIAKEDQNLDLLPANFTMPEALPSGIQSYPVPVLHYLKMGLDDLVGDPSSGLGAVTRNQAKTVRQRILDALEGRVPEYRVARETYRGDNEAVEAFELGRKALAGDLMEIQHEVSKMSPSEMEQFRLGFLSGVEREVTQSTPGRVAGRLGVGQSGTPARRTMMETVLPSASGQQRAGQMLLDEERMMEPEKVFGGSPTAPRQESLREEWRNGGSLPSIIGRRLRQSLLDPTAESESVLRAKGLMMGSQEANRYAPAAARLQGVQTSMRDVGKMLGTGAAAGVAPFAAPADQIGEAEAYFADLIQQGVDPERALMLTRTVFKL